MVNNKPRNQNNFDFIRLVAAIFVVFTHSFDLLGRVFDEPLRAITKSQTSFSFFGVRIFFIISGYLITQSLLTSKNFGSYLGKRALRIFPGLIVVVLLTIFILGPLVTTVSLTDYFRESETYEYIKNILLYRWQPSLPGVFENNMHPVVNGSLWTLVYEFTFYLLLAILNSFKLLTNRFLIFSSLVVLIIIDSYLNRDNLPSFFVNYRTVNMSPSNLVEFAIFFGSGTLFYLNRDNIRYKPVCGWLLIIVFTLMLWLAPIHISKLSNYFILPFIVFFLAFRPGKLNKFGELGDYSYGLYIYSFPIQNLLISQKPTITVAELFLYSITFILPFVYFSWNYVESPALKLKRLFK